MKKLFLSALIALVSVTAFAQKYAYINSEYILSNMAEYKEAQAEARLKRIELEDAKEKIELQVTQANFRYEEALKTFEATKANLTEANENLRIAQIGFKEGVATADDVLAAQTAWLKAHSEEVDAEIDVRMCDVYLAKVLGKMNY